MDPATTSARGRELAGDREPARDREQGVLRLGSRSFAPHELLVMAIVNRTRDSFYDHGATFAEAAAVDAAERALDAGADVVDIGGVRAGALGEEVGPAEEIDRVAGVVARLRPLRPEAVISVDTWRAEVGRAVAEVGADLLNDPWQGYDPGLAEVAAAHGLGLVCAHSGHLPPRTDPDRPQFDDVVVDVVRTVEALAARAVSLGVRPDGILIDPAHDFGKSTLHSLEITRRAAELVATGWPVLMAMSNKDFVGQTLGLPVQERLPGTLAATAVAAWQGARVFRAHNVAQTRQVLDMIASIRGDRPPVSADR